jgi:hypothetical protein
MRYIYYYYFILKGMSLNWLEISLVYELPNCRCITSRMTYLLVWRLLILINSLQKRDVKFIWSVCGPNELRLKRCIRTPIGWKGVFAHIQACDISIYMDWCSVSVCEKQHDRTKTLKEKERISSKREMVQFLHDKMRTSCLDVIIEEVAAFRL